MRSLLAAGLIFCSLISPASALDRGYWVIIGNLPQDDIDPAAQEEIQSQASQCGFEAFNDFSFKFGFKPGYIAFVLGAYATKAEANAVLKSVRRCVPDAYVKQGAYSGE
jgi:hypothetical protein